MQKLKPLDDIKSSKRAFQRIRGIYFLFLDERLVYVGQSVDIHIRINAHLIGRKMEFDSYAFVEYKREELNDLEREYIAWYKPLHNIVHAHGMTVEQYSSWRRLVDRRANADPR